MKRPLEYIAGGFVLGEVLALLPVVWIAGILVGVTAGVCYLWKRNGRSLIWWLLPVFCVMGLIWVKEDRRRWEELRGGIEALEEERVKITGKVAGIWGGKEGERLTLELTGVTCQSKDGKESWGSMLAYVDDSETVLAVGMTVQLEGKPKAFDEPGNPGEFDYGAYYHALGIQGRFFGERLRLVSGDYAPWPEGIRRIKSGAAKILAKICTAEDLGVFQAMVLGEKGELSGEIRDLYQRSGIAHLLAVSGLHVSMIGMGGFLIFRKIGFRPGGAAAAGGVLTVSYGMLAQGPGIGAGILRAVIMVLLQMGAEWLGRTYDLETAVSVCALLLLIRSPGLLFQAGFQLSFGAVFTLGAAVPVAERWLDLRSGFEKTMAAGIMVQIATCPVVAYHYFEYPVCGIGLNFLVIPLMSYVLISGILGIAAGTVSVKLGTAAVGIGHYVLAFYQILCEKVQEFPWAVVTTGRPGLWQIGCYGVIWILFFMVMSESGNRKKGETDKEGRKRKQKRITEFLLIGAGSMLLLFFRLPMKGMEVTFLDVGQGDGICIRTKDTVILVDGGSADKKNLGEQVLLPFLKSQGISQVDYAMVSHGDQDHISGLTKLLEEGSKIRVKQVILPWLGQGGKDESYERLKKAAEAHGAGVAWMRRGDGILAGELKIRCLYAGEERNLGKDGDRNEHSLLLSVQYGRAGILLTGDMSSGGEQAWLALEERPEVEVLKIAHHGSAYSTKAEFLDRVRPDIAVISCGEGNRYGHPAKETLGRLKERGIPWFITKDQGAIRLKTDGKKLSVTPFLP